jgi:hypothetical protein
MTIALPFECLVLDEHPVEITNPFSGESCVLTPEAVAVYDTIKGAEMIGDWTTVQQGIDWFIENFPSEYMTLLD